MERPQLILQIRDLKREQFNNKMDHNAKLQFMQNDRNAELYQEKKRWEEEEEKHRAIVNTINDTYNGNVKEEMENYQLKQQNVEDRIATIKAEYFKDHPLERLD